jgi:uncharacterized membrane protein HdeD (DUF308 family)
MSGVIIGTSLLSDFHQRLEQRIAAHKDWYFIQSASCAFAGIVAMLLPSFSSLPFATAIGALLVINGLQKVLSGVRSEMHWWCYVSATVSIATGAAMLWLPLSGITMLATLVAIYLFAEGIAGICLGFELESARNWGWVSIAGVASLILSGVLFFGWPGMTVASLGFMIGASLVLYGASLLAVSAATPSYEIL